jgi:hypothetical protein
VLALIDPADLDRRLGGYFTAAALAAAQGPAGKGTGLVAVAIDGKTLRLSTRKYRIHADLHARRPGRQTTRAGRIKSSRRPPILERLSDGSYRSVIVGVLRAAPHHRGWSRPALGRSGRVEQEMWLLLTLYQLLRTVMVDAAESRPGTDPDRVSFAIAFQAARRLRVSTRKVKSPISRYHARQDDGRPATSDQPQGTHPGPASQRPRAPLARP